MKDAMPIVAAIIAALVGGIAAAFFVHWLTRSSKQTTSMRDADKEEWRELRSALTKIEMYQSMGSATDPSEARPTTRIGGSMSPAFGDVGDSGLSLDY